MKGCVCCFLSTKSTKLVTGGHWVSTIGAPLKRHENRPDPCNNMVEWKDFAFHLSNLFMKCRGGGKEFLERRVLVRFISII